MKLTFWGAAQQVTGSMYLLELDDEYKILIDCGMEMEKKSAIVSEKQYGLFPFEASQINAVLLTHAHIDHSGFIPNLIKEGYEGRILCTSATYELTRLLLEDSAALNQRKLKRLHQLGSKKRKLPDAKGGQSTKEMYLQKQVDEAMELFEFAKFHNRIKIKKGVYATFLPAGHLLGAAHIILEIEENGQQKSICFSGDLGRKNYPLLIDPDKVPQVDYLISESTYGNRQHQAEGNPEDKILEVIKSTCVDMPGRLIIPAFSVGRTQALLFTLKKLQVFGKLPAIKIFADSPLALKTTFVYQKYQSWLNKEAIDFAQNHQSLFDFENLIYIENMKESKAISNYDEPCIIISSSGMIQGGRVEFHVKKNIQNSYATILLVGFASEGTVAHDLMHGKKTIEIEGKELSISARIESTDIFSGHGDLEDLINFVKQQDTSKLKKLFLVHGEANVMQDFKQTLESEGYPQVVIPKKGESFEL